MQLYLNPYGFLGTFSLVLGWVLAGLVWAKGRGTLQSRFLALLLVLLSTAWGMSCGVMYFGNDAPTALGFQAIGGFCMAAELPVYVLFLSTLPTRWMAWARPLWVRVALGISSPLLGILLVANFNNLLEGVIAVPYARYDVVFSELGLRILQTHSILTATMGIGVALATVRESAAGTIARRQAVSYAVAFIWFDAMQLLAFGVLEFAFHTRPPQLILYTIAAAWLLPLALLGLLLLLAYGMLRFQLFDIDLRIKVGLRRSFVVAPIALAFFIASETLEGLLPFDSYWAGIGAAGLITVAIVPLQKGAHRLADRVMPGVEDTKQYRDRRADDIYRMALDSVLEDGTVGAREEVMLERLGKRLGLSPTRRAALHRL